MFRHVTWMAPLAALVLAGCARSTGPGQNAASQAAAGVSSEVRYSNAAGDYRAVVYTPASYSPKQPMPVVLMVHGCNTTAEQQRAANRFDALAEREGFIVVYPDLVTVTHPLQCWRFYDPAEFQRGLGDADGIAGLTQAVLAQWAIDAERVYVVGMSAGGYMASILGAAYPDLYAAIGIAEAGGYGVGFAGVAQSAGTTVLQPELFAQLAYQQMGSRARVVPALNFQGSEDTTATPAVGAHAVQQWLMTNNLVLSGAIAAPLPLTPSTTQDGLVPGGHAYAIDDYLDASGCPVVRQVRIDGMSHFWPGGSDAPEVAAFTDPLAPSGAELSWDFFRRYRKSQTGQGCTPVP